MPRRVLLFLIIRVQTSVPFILPTALETVVDGSQREVEGIRRNIGRPTGACHSLGQGCTSDPRYAT
jgi:hypothetical protein